MQAIDLLLFWDSLCPLGSRSDDDDGYREGKNQDSRCSVKKKKMGEGGNFESGELRV